MTVSFQRMFGILERCNNNQVTPSLSKPHGLRYRSNIIIGQVETRRSCDSLAIPLRPPVSLMHDSRAVSIRKGPRSGFWLICLTSLMQWLPVSARRLPAIAGQ